MALSSFVLQINCTFCACLNNGEIIFNSFEVQVWDDFYYLSISQVFAECCHSGAVLRSDGFLHCQTNARFVFWCCSAPSVVIFVHYVDNLVFLLHTSCIFDRIR